MPATDIIKEYLIKLGVDISANEISKMEKSLSRIDKGIVDFFKRWNNAFLLFSKQYTKIVSRIVSFNTEISKNDMYLQRWAKTMYLTVDSARALDRTLSAMGLDVEDLKDVALNPELTRQYKELIQLSKSLTVGKSFEKAAKHFREINFEFQRLKVIAEYFKERIVAYTWKFMESSAGKNFALMIRKFTDFGVSIMDKVAQRVGLFFSRVITGATRLMEIGSELYETFIRPVVEFFNSMGTWGKAISSLFAEIGLAILAGPFGKAFLIIQKFVEIIDDYLVWKSGGKAALGGFWNFFDESKKKPGEPKTPGLPSQQEYEQHGFGPVGQFFGHVGELPGKAVYWTSSWLKSLFSEDSVGVHPALLPQNTSEDSALGSALKEYMNQNYSPVNNTTNNTPITININGTGDPQSVAEKTVALIRNRRGVFA